VGQAQLYTVAATGAGTRFQVPQVRLPDAGVARRVNQQLLRYVTSEFSRVDSTASPRQQLHQAALEWYYDTELKS